MVVFVGPVIVSLLFLLHQAESNCENFISDESTGLDYKREEFSFNITEATLVGVFYELDNLQGDNFFLFCLQGHFQSKIVIF